MCRPNMSIIKRYSRAAQYTYLVIMKMQFKPQLDTTVQ